MCTCMSVCICMYICMSVGVYVGPEQGPLGTLTKTVFFLLYFNCCRYNRRQGHMLRLQLVCETGNRIGRSVGRSTTVLKDNGISFADVI